MNRLGLGLAVGAGYLLGRTKKLKMAVAVGGLVAGKKLNLSPRMVADLVSQQLQNNPQFKEIGDQLRGELRGVGKAASGALVERQLGSIADKLHGRTADMRDRLAGVVPQDGDEEAADEADDVEDTEDTEDEEPEDHESDEEPEDDESDEEPERTAKKAPPKDAAKKAAKKAPGKKAATTPPGKRAAAPAKKAAARKTAAKKTAASRGGRSRTSKGGGER